MVAWEDEKTIALAALDRILPTLAHPYLTSPLARLLAKETNLPEPRCFQALGWICKEHPHATHDGSKVRMFGRETVRWRWHPTPQTLELTPEMRAEPEEHERQLAERDAAVFGVGFLLGGKRIDPAQVQIFRPSAAKSKLPASKWGDELGIDQSDW